MFAKTAQGIERLTLNGLWANALQTQASNSHTYWLCLAHTPLQLYLQATGGKKNHGKGSQKRLIYDGFSNQQLPSLSISYVTSFNPTILFKFSALVFFPGEQLTFQCIAGPLDGEIHKERAWDMPPTTIHSQSMKTRKRCVYIHA